MLELFKPKHRSILGIDITSSAVKILEISGSGDSLTVEGYGRELLPVDALDGNVIKNIDAVATSIRKLCDRAQLTCKQAALAVPDSAAISKIVQVNDGLSEEDLEEIVFIEADKFVPYPIDEVNLDFDVLGPSAKNPAMQDVLIVASRSENVNNRVDTVQQAGLVVKIVDVEHYAVERAAQLLAQQLPAGGEGKIVAIIDLGAVYTHLFVLNGMKLVFSREEKFGGLQLTEAIAEHYNMTIPQAFIAKEQSRLPDDYESLVLAPFVELVLLQVKRTLQFFYSSSQNGFIDHILLAGGLARQSNLPELIHEQSGIVTTVANPFASMTLGPNVNRDLIINDAPALLVACGLALRHLE